MSGLVLGLGLVLGYCLMAGESRAGAFTLPEGQGLMIAGVGYVEAPRSFNDSGKAAAAPDFRKLETGAFAAYGLTDGVTLIAAPALVHMSAGAPGASYTGSDESAIGAQIRLFQSDRQALSIQAVVEPAVGTRVAAIQFGNPNGWAGLVKLQFAQALSLAGYSAFFDIASGALVRAGGWPSEGRLDMTLGLTPVTGTTILIQNFTRAAPSGGPGIPQTAETKLQLSLVHDLSARWSVQLGGLRTLYGRNAALETGPLAALWMRF